jgi:hypothetical protein
MGIQSPASSVFGWQFNPIGLPGRFGGSRGSLFATLRPYFVQDGQKHAPMSSSQSPAHIDAFQ